MNEKNKFSSHSINRISRYQSFLLNHSQSGGQKAFTRNQNRYIWMQICGSDTNLTMVSRSSLVCSPSLTPTITCSDSVLRLDRFASNSTLISKQALNLLRVWDQNRICTIGVSTQSLVPVLRLSFPPYNGSLHLVLSFSPAAFWIFYALSLSKNDFYPVFLLFSFPANSRPTFNNLSSIISDS
jgi:hypothetical protein